MGDKVYTIKSGKVESEKVNPSPVSVKEIAW
jgi:hypothetical protein